MIRSRRSRRPADHPTHPPRGAVLIRRIEGGPARYQLSLFPFRPGMVAGSASTAWHLARGFARRDGVGVWFTADGRAFSPASEHPPAE